MEQTKIKVLFRGWFLQHSYGIVNCFQLLSLLKKFEDKIEFYVEEMEYYRPEWNSTKKLVFGEENNKILERIRRWNGEKVDLVYSITYPYNISNVNIDGKNIPKCVFYTSEFSNLDSNYFCFDKMSFGNNEDIAEYLKLHPEICFTSPSEWSSGGIKRYGVSDDKNRVITHGVNLDIFRKHKDDSNRQKLREFYKVKESDILLLNIGAMTQNKGIVLILVALNELVNRRGHKHFKLLLKGTGDLYTSKTFLEAYFEKLQKDNKVTKQEVNILLEEHIIFSDKTISYERINDLFNAADLYVSPYLAEGFNLVPLEALSAGLPVVVPETGSTKEYMSDLYKNGGEKFIFYVKSEVMTYNDSMKQNRIAVEDLVETLDIKMEVLKEIRKERHDVLRSYIESNYSWDKVGEYLYEYFKYIVEKNF
jgi:glycosyltransferase involved in cell wall biosynthesis